VPIAGLVQQKLCRRWRRSDQVPLPSDSTPTNMADETKPDVETINLKVATQDGNEIFFKVRPSHLTVEPVTL